mgnify:CR=1 FL=1
MLDNLKALLGLPEEDISQDKKLQLILTAAKSRLKLLLGGIEPPEELNYIIVDISIKRFNRIGSEGTTIHQVEGESRSFADDDFAEYEEDIKRYLDKQKDVQKGRMRFI